MSKQDFNYELGDTVEIDASGEQGTVIARAEYLNSEDQYQLRYACADGRAVEQWWADSALSPVE